MSTSVAEGKIPSSKGKPEPPLKAYRIVKRKFAFTAFSGEGAASMEVEAPALEAGPPVKSIGPMLLLFLRLLFFR